MVQLFRGMTEDEDGSPKLGDSSRRLGVRGAIDVPAVTDSEMVLPGTGGLSVSPDSLAPITKASTTSRV